MPELPDVEITQKRLAPIIEGTTIQDTVIYESRLRWPIATNLPRIVKHQIIQSTSRRGKYLLFTLNRGTLILHLGMTGSLILKKPDVPKHAHDRVMFRLNNGWTLWFRDQRRLGSIHWTQEDPNKHGLLQHLGVEPLTNQFTDKYLYKIAHKRRCTIKSLIMNANVVVGVGNVYANEALFVAGIHPKRPANQLDQQACKNLVKAIKDVLTQTIQDGLTPLQIKGQQVLYPTYFEPQLRVYDRANLPCLRCQTPLKQEQLHQRRTVFCPKCQK